MSDPVDMVQLLTPTGERVDHPDFKYSGSDEDILGLFRDMVMARRFDIEGTLLQRQGELGLWPPLLGQEASQVGSGRAVGRHDMVFPSYREHGVAWCVGVDPGEVMGLFRGTHMASWNSREKRFHNYTIIIGAQALHATGYAMGLQRDGMVGNADSDDNAACITYFGDGATSQGDVHEAMVFANSYQAPVVFFCTNNQWAISEPVTRQSRVPLYQRAAGYGMPGIRVDGNDVLAVKAVTEWALERARSGQGPAMIESYTYRMGPHTTSDDPTKYRLTEETESWKSKDPIERVKRYLLGKGLIDDAYLAKLDEEGDDLGEHLRETCKTLPNPEMDMIWDNTYVTKTAVLEREQQAWGSYAASFEENN